MTIVVLGFDGLEFNLVEELDLRYIKQKRYSKLCLEDFDIIVTPPIWASMITGVVFEEMLKEFISVFHSNRGWKATMKNLLPWEIRELLSKLLSGFQRKCEKNPMATTAEFLSRKKISTIFDEYKCWHNIVPGFNKKSGPLEVKSKIMFGEAFEKKETTVDFLRQQETVFSEDVNHLFEALCQKENYDLIFWYTGWLDLVGHLQYGNRLKTVNRYLRIHSLAYRIQKRLDDKDTLLIISDHGMLPAGRRGYHSDHGFFSSSTGDLIGKPQELYSLMKKLVGRRL